MTTETVEFPQLDALLRHLEAHEGRIGEAEAPLAVAVLKEYLYSGAKMKRNLRQVTARFRPADVVGATISWLFVVTVDAAVHEGREHTLKAYSEQTGKPLAKETGELYEILVSEEYARAIGRRPIMGNHRGCAPF